MPIDKETIQKARKAHQEESQLEMLGNAVKAIQDKESITAINDTLKSIEGVLKGIELPKSEVEAVMKELAKLSVNSEVRSSVRLEALLKQMASQHEKSTDELSKAIASLKSNESLNLVVKELAQIKEKIQNDSNAEWVMTIERDHSERPKTVIMKRIK